MIPSIAKTVTLDFETYYSSSYSLRSIAYNTSSYIRDPQFQARCCSIKIGEGKTRCYAGAKIAAALQKIDWTTHGMLAHNTAFDGFIAATHYGIVPCFYFDTMAMTRGLHAGVSRAGLDAIARLYGIGAKGVGALENTKGKLELTKEELAQLMEYCIHDTELCFEVYKKQRAVYPLDELRLIDLTVRMFCDSKLEVDIPRARVALRNEMLAREHAIAQSGASEQDLLSNPRFAAALEKQALDRPQKSA